MCDNFDDFEDNFDNDDFMYDDSFEGGLEGALDEPYAGENEPEDEIDETESNDDFTAKDAFITGGAFGFGYEQGFRERKRRKRKRFKEGQD